MTEVGKEKNSKRNESKDDHIDDINIDREKEEQVEGKEAKKECGEGTMNKEAKKSKEKKEGKQVKEKVHKKKKGEVEKLEKGKKEKDQDFKNKYYYLAAEFENTRKRFEREKNNLIKFGNEKILSSLIEVIDNFDRTLEVLEKEDDKKIKDIASGIEMVRKQFWGILSKNGLKQVESVGKIFDPNFHEAMAQQPMEGKKDQEIISEYQKGYILNGRLIRAAKVIVAKVDEEKQMKTKIDKEK